MNCTILEMARAMLHHGNMHPSYWMDAVMTAVYLINLSVPKSSNVTRYEAWTGHKSSVSHLRVFGCNAYRHILKDQRDDKMSATVSECSSDTTKRRLGTIKSGTHKSRSFIVLVMCTLTNKISHKQKLRSRTYGAK